MTTTEVVLKRGLTEADAAAIRALEEVCNQADGIRVKLNWGMMNNRDPEKISDFCGYRDGELIGYMPLDSFGDEYEITAIVRPDCRQQGVFKRLYEAAREEAQKQEAKQLLLVNYRASEPGNAVVKALGLAYKFSEYRMEAENLPTLPVSQLSLKDAVGEADMTELSQMLGINFGASEWNSAALLMGERGREDSRYFLVKREEITIGHVGVLVEGGSGGIYIRAVGINPEWRKQGYGRQLLSTVLQKMLAEGHTRFELDVATENEQALSLYQSCGFHQTNVYDYYIVSLTNSS